MAKNISCIADGQYQQAAGVALECRRLDLLEEAIMKSPSPESLLAYTLRASQNLVHRREFRQTVTALFPVSKFARQ